MLSVILMLLCSPVTRQAREATAQPPQSAGEPAPERSPEEVRQIAEAYLGSIDRPITEAQWRQLGPQAAPLLEQIAHDSEQLPTRRAKALHGLGAIGSATAPDTMLVLARDEKQPLTVRLAAIQGAERVVPPGQLAPSLQAVLQGAGNGHVRRAAAEVIARHGGCAVVKQQAQRETERAWMSGALEKCAE